MNRENWKPKLGDKVMVVGHLSLSGIGEISSQIGLQPEWFWISNNRVHIRNLDPVLEDERKGAPRPAPVEGEAIDLLLPGRIVCREYATPPIHRLRAEANCSALEYGDPRVRQIERRGPNLGREARKS